MTHPLGAGTNNVTLNLLKEERAVLARLAAETDRSLGSLMRDLIHRGLGQVNPAIAEQVSSLRKHHRAALLGAALALVLGAAWLATAWPSDAQTAPIIAGGAE